MASIDYDPESDSLYIYKGKENVKSSIDIGNVIIDISFDRKAVGIEILDATKAFELRKKELKNIKKANIRTILRPNFFGIKIKLLLSRKHLISTL